MSRSSSPLPMLSLSSEPSTPAPVKSDIITSTPVTPALTKKFTLNPSAKPFAFNAHAAVFTPASAATTNAVKQTPTPMPHESSVTDDEPFALNSTPYESSTGLSDYLDLAATASPMLSSRKLPSSSPPSIVFDEPTSSHNPYVTDDQPYYYEPDVESFYDNDMSYMAVQTAYLMESTSSSTSPLMHSTSLRSDRRRIQHTHMSGTGSPPLFAQRTDLYFEQDLHLTDVMGRARYRYTREEMLAMRASTFDQPVSIPATLISIVAGTPNEEQPQRHRLVPVSGKKKKQRGRIYDDDEDEDESGGRTMFGHVDDEYTADLDAKLNDLGIMSSFRIKSHPGHASTSTSANASKHDLPHFRREVDTSDVDLGSGNYTSSRGRKQKNKKKKMEPPMSATQSHRKAAARRADDMLRGSITNKHQHTNELIHPDPVHELALLHQSNNRWTPIKSNQSEKEHAAKVTRAVLNKLTPEKFDKHITTMLAIPVTCIETLDAIIEIIFSKATDESNFASLYARFCASLDAHMPEFPTDTKPASFRSLLLTKCYTTLVADPVIPRTGNMTELERDEKESRLRHQQMGNLIFIGELFKQSLLARSIMHVCIDMLLDEIDDPTESDIESLCVLLTTVGQMLDAPSTTPHTPMKPSRKLKTLQHDEEDDESGHDADGEQEHKHPPPSTSAPMDLHFIKITRLSTNKSLPSRLRFMILDLIELRSRSWIPRQAKVVDPQMLATVRATPTPSPITPQLKRATTQVHSATTSHHTPNAKFQARMSSHTTIKSRPPRSSPLTSPTTSQDIRFSFPQHNIPPMQRSISAPHTDTTHTSHHIPSQPEGGEASGHAMRIPHTPDKSVRPHGKKTRYVKKITTSSPTHRKCSTSSISSGLEIDGNHIQDHTLSHSSSSSPNSPETSPTPMSTHESRSSSPSPSTSIPPHIMRHKIDLLIAELFECHDINEAIQCVVDVESHAMSTPPLSPIGDIPIYTQDDPHQYLIFTAVALALEQKPIHRDLITSLFTRLYTTQHITCHHFMAAIRELITVLSDLVIDIPKAPMYLCSMISHACIDGMLTYPQVCHLMHPLTETEDMGNNAGVTMMIDILHLIQSHDIKLLSSWYKWDVDTNPIMTLFTHDGNQQHVDDMMKSKGIHIHEEIITSSS